MIIEIKKPVTRKKVEKALALAVSVKKKKTLRKHFGKLKRGLDGLTVQKKMRDEWD